MQGFEELKASSVGSRRRPGAPERRVHRARGLCRHGRPEAEMVVGAGPGEQAMSGLLGSRKGEGQ